MQAYSLAQVIQLSLFDLWGRVVGILPDLLGAVLIIFIGLLIAPILGGIAKKIVDVLKVDDLAEKMGIHDMVKGYSNKFSISKLIGKLVKWFFILAFVMAAADILEWEGVTQFIETLAFFVAHVLMAVIILVFGVIAGKFLEVVVVRSLQGAAAPINNPELLGKITKWAIIIFAASAALIQLGVAQSLIEILFAGLVLALALAFGLGGREHAAKLLTHLSAKKK